MFSRVRRASGGVGWVGGVGEVITFVGTFTHIPYYMFSRVRRASGGVGWVGGVGEVITFVGTFTHIFHTTCFPRHAEPHCVDLNRVDLNQTRNVCLLTRLAQDLALASHKRSAC